MRAGINVTLEDRRWLQAILLDCSSLAKEKMRIVLGGRGEDSKADLDGGVQGKLLSQSWSLQKCNDIGKTNANVTILALLALGLQAD